MSRYQFNVHQRYAIFTVHGERCYLCGRPIDLQTMQVDHIIPETLAENSGKLAATLEALGRPATFNVNSYENWLPSCAPCNNRKRDSVFEPAPIILIELDRAARRAMKVRETVEKAIHKAEITKALNLLERAAARKQLGESEISMMSELVLFHQEHRAPEAEGQPLRLTPLYQVLVDDGVRQIIKGPFGVGARPAQRAHSSWSCSVCGSIGAWNGPRCVVCGTMDGD